MKRLLTLLVLISQINISVYSSVKLKQNFEPVMTRLINDDIAGDENTIRGLCGGDDYCLGMYQKKVRDFRDQKTYTRRMYDFLDMLRGCRKITNRKFDASYARGYFRDKGY